MIQIETKLICLKAGMWKKSKYDDLSKAER